MCIGGFKSMRYISDDGNVFNTEKECRILFMSVKSVESSQKKEKRL